MEVILLEDVVNLGPIGTLKNVADGYARNYLIPKKLADVASSKNKARLEHQKREANFRSAKIKAHTQAMANKLSNMVLTLPRKVGEQNKLFGSVTTQDIQEALAIRQVEVDRRKIDLAEPIRQTGEYEVVVRLGADLKNTVKVMVVAEK